MVTDRMIAAGRLKPGCLEGEVVVVTGGGGGIGLEAARSLLWLGASVAIAEIDGDLGRAALAALGEESDPQRVLFRPTDVADEASVKAFVNSVEERFGKIDVVLNNATFSPAGSSVIETPIEVWDRSYAVNLRGPALLARICLPGMLTRKHGAFVCVSSTGGPYLAPYETLKAAQLALANSLDAELTDSGVVAFTIGPGLVPTRTALAAIERLAPRLGTTVDQFWTTNRGAVLSVEAAGAGFAAAIALADRYAGQEISSSQALVDAGIELPDDRAAGEPNEGPVTEPAGALRACQRVRATLAEQSAGWKERSFFERQWMLRDFKQRVGMPVERCLELMGAMEARLRAGGQPPGPAENATLEKLAGFYVHLGELARGYLKDPKLREEQVQITAAWASEVRSLL